MSDYLHSNGYKYSKNEVTNMADSAVMSFDEFVESRSLKLVGTPENQEQENVSWFDQTWFGRGVAAASTTGEATDLMSQNFSNIDMESIQEFMKAKESEAKSHVPSDRMSKFQEQYVKEGKTWAAFFRGVKDQPGLLPELFVQSLGTQIGTAIDSPGASLGAAATGAGVGAAVAGPLGALTGAMGGLATSMEAALTFGELIETRLKEKNQEFTDENIKALLETEGTEIRNRSIGRGLTIGAIEGLSGGLAGKAGVVASKAAKGAKRATVAAGVAGIGVEAAGGATGEILGRAVAGQEMDAAEIGFEAITGTVTAPLNVSAALLTAKQPTYKLNGASVTYEQMKKFVDTADDMDVAKADIKMENDFTGIGKKAQAKQEAAIESVKLSGDVETIAEVAKAQSENRIAATIELAKQGKQIGNVKDSFTVENNEEATKAYKEIQDQYGKDIIPDKDITDADGFFVPTPDGNVIIINKDIAAQTGQINVGGHELLHAVVQKHYESLSPEARAKFINDFKNTISKDSLAYVQKIIDARNKDVTDSKTGKTIKGENLQADSDEYLTIYSDGIVKKQITYNEGMFTKFKNFLQDIFRKFGYNKEFGSGLDTYNFMRDYNKNITEFNKISQRALGVAGSEAVVGESKLSRGTLIDDINKLQQGATTKAEFQKSDIFNNVFKSVQPNGAVSNYIKSLQMSREKTQETIDSVTDRLINFNPEAKRKDGTVIGPEGLGEFMMANVGFGKLDAAKALAVKAEKAKKTTRLDDPDVKDIADEDKKTTGTSNVKTKLVQTKARQLTNLADLDVESSPLIKQATKIQLKKLIESNPKNLIQEIQNVLISDLVEITRQEMGVIGQVKGELNIPETYNAYLSNTYQKTISSMEILKIRTNYKNLFKKEKMGFADYKTEKSNKPDLKKDSNYRKDIFRNVTTKAEFIKYHTEGKKNKLIANQRNLALMRAEAEVVRAADNYIRENSSDLNQVYAADLRSFIDSKTIQKQQEENKSFDSVKYSKTLYTGVTGIRDAVLTAEDVFDNNGNLLPAYKNIAGNEVDSKAAGDFIWNNIDLLNPDTNFKFIRKAYEKLYKEGKRGTAYETNLIQTAVALENIYGKETIEVLLKKPTESDALPDMILRVGGVVMNIEAKMALAQYSSVTNAIVDGSMVIKKEYSPEFMKILTELQKQSQKGIKRAQNFLKSQKPPIAFDNIKEISQEGHDLLKNSIDPITSKSYFNGMSATLPLPLKFISEIYNNKKHPVFLMQLMGRGLFSMGGDNFNLGIPALEDGGDGFITLRVGSNSKYQTVTVQEGVKMKVKSGMRSYSYRSIPGISDKVLNLMKSNRNIESVAGLKKLLDSDEVKRLKTQQEAKSKQTFSKAVKKSRTPQDSKGITVLDFDDTLATSKSLIKYTQPDGTKGTLTPEQYASTYQDLQDLGYDFDFSEFNKVVDGKVAPLFQKALKLQSKFGPENMFVLTARPAESAPAIFAFIKANGLNIPLKNITGLANSTAEAKALWIAEKVGEGYNDFYFADDALQNVQAVKNMLDQFDVKSKVQQAKVKFSKSMNDQFNNILENITGIESEKRFDFIKARKRGASKGKFRYFIPPSHEDFVGLLYNFMGKGLEGNKHRDFLEQALVRPLNRANKEYDTARQSVATGYKNLNKQMPDVKKKLIKKTPDGDFTYQDAIRIYLWDKHGYDIPGLSPIDQKNLVELVDSDPNLKSYAETINTISKQETYVNPTDGWDSGDIRMDLDDATGRIGRAQFFEEFIENADIIFSKENLNKIEAGYGKGVREALEDILYRIKTGRNKPTGQNKMVNGLMNWINGSVGSVMFFNMRSALLQQMSIVNYINFADNNVFAAAKAFANQKQYWADWAFIFNSDMLKQRRGGIMTDVNGAELAADMRKSKNPHRFLISKLLELGFLPTQIGDNIAIATGGASYYRNKVNSYLKQGLNQKEAETKAFTDFQDITQSTQQSARPDMVSQQQASIIGKVILNFQNVTSQFNRLGKKAFQDIYNRRITKPNTTQLQSDISNASRITYYFAVQNAIFYTLQTALFAMMFDDDEEDVNNLFLKKKERLINGSIDSVLRGTGIGGSIISTLKNVAIAFARQRDVNYNPDESAVVVEALNFSPVLGIKARKIVNAEKTLNYNKKVIKEMETFDIDNPQWSAVTNYTEGFTNLPLNRLYNKTQNVRQGLSNEHAAWERTLLFLGWSQYNLNLENEKMDRIKESTKSEGQKKKNNLKGGTPRKNNKLKTTKNKSSGLSGGTPRKK